METNPIKHARLASIPLNAQNYQILVLWFILMSLPNSENCLFYLVGGEARVLGPSVLRPRMGAVVDLTCLVYHSVPSPNITWFRSGTEIKGRSAGGLKISTTRGPSTTVSTLRIHGVNAGDEGKYSCAGEGLNSTSAVLLSLLHQTTDWNRKDFEVVNY